MILLIDAYNILKRVYLGQYISENQKSLFINKLVKYCINNKNNKIIVIFDGGGNIYPDIETRKNINNLTIVHSGSKLTADDYIKEYIEQNHKKAEFLLVSSDRELKNYARKFNIESIDGYNFYNLIDIEEQNKQNNSSINNNKIFKLVRENEPENLELDKLMQQSGDIKFIKPENSQEQENNKKRSRNPKVASKEEKKIIKIIKKI